MRVFFDRLVDDKDREWLFDEIRINVNNILQEQFDTMFKDLSSSTVRRLYIDRVDRYCSFLYSHTFLWRPAAYSSSRYVQPFVHQRVGRGRRGRQKV